MTVQPAPDYAAILRIAPRDVLEHARDYLLAGHVEVRPGRRVITGQAGPQCVAAYVVAPSNVAAWSCECGAVGSVDRSEHGLPCEHVVAVVLAWLADEDTAVAVPRPTR
jgi:hypothetical protein